MRKSKLALLLALAFTAPAFAAQPAAPEPPEQSVEGALTPEEEDIINRAFKGANIEMLPMSPKQINQFQKRMDETIEAIHPSPPPKLIRRSQSIALQPGGATPVVRIAPGYVSSILVVDATGAPWPITTSTVGNDKWFSVVRPETAEGNLITVSPLTNHASSNLAITLANRDMPLLIQLVVADKAEDKKPYEADALVSFQINATGPNAKPPIVGDRIDSPATPDMISFLDGVPPIGAIAVKFDREIPGVSAWEYQGMVYLRSQYPARWPAWTQVARGSGEVRVYAMPKTPSIILSIDGQNTAFSIAN